MTAAWIGPPDVTLADVQAAAKTVAGVALRTPLLRFAQPDDETGRPRLWLKPESLQPIGAFKIRGAYNALASLSDEQRAAGVVTHSSGNHAQGIARAARLLGITAVIVMPDDAPAIKLAGVVADGAEIDVVGADNEERIRRADELAAERGLVLIPSYDDARIIAGQGTVGLEIVEQLAELGTPEGPLTVIAPVGGGGLTAGLCVGVKGLRPDARIVGVEPELAADAAESMRAGRLVRWQPALTGRTIADGVRTSALGELNWSVLRERLDGVVTVSEDDIRVAMLEAATGARLVVEPSGALAIAGYRRHAAEFPSRGDVVLVVSGGNVDPAAYRAALDEASTIAERGA